MWEKILPNRVIGAITAATDNQTQVWLVGGAVRDFFLDRETHDFDFAVSGEARRLARLVADNLGGAYYDLDAQRDTGRVLPPMEQAGWGSLDFASLRADTIEGDLAGRDFTINAMAFSMEQEPALLDPTGGLADIRRGMLNLCHPQGLMADPVRAIRALRLSVELALQIDRSLIERILVLQSEFANVAVERVRDELFRILSLPRPAQALRLAEQLNLEGKLMPRLSGEQLLGGFQRQDHLSKLLAAIVGQHDESATADWVTGQASVRLGRYRSKLEADLQTVLAGDRSRRQQLFWATLYVPDSFPPSILESLQQDLRLSRVEIMNVSRMARAWRHYGGEPLAAAVSQRDRFRYFDMLGEVGVEFCLLALAEVLSRQAGPPAQAEWELQIERARQLLMAWYEGPVDQINPEPLVRGDELIEFLGISPGPIVGEIVAALREEQAAGEINSYESALALARRLYLKRR